MGKNEEYRELLAAAKAAAKNAYHPYLPTSNGSALLTSDGEILVGFSIQTPNVGSSVCAGKAVVIHALLAGHRDFRAIAIAGDGVDSDYLCGECRQFLAEFGLDIDIISEINPTVTLRLRDLFPKVFHLPTVK